MFMESDKHTALWMMVWKELNPLFLWSVLLKLGNEALKAPCVQQTQLILRLLV